MKSLLKDCIQDTHQKSGGATSINPDEFKQMFCHFCRNSDCVHAEWAVDKFSERVNNQEDRFFNAHKINPSDYKKLEDFVNLTTEVLHMSIQKSWDIPITDGVDETAAVETTTAVDDAAKVLAKSRNQDLNIPDAIEIKPEPEPEPVKTTKSETKSIETKHSEQSKKTLNNTTQPSHGIMIGGGSAKIEQPKDPWDPTDHKKIVKPGVKITLGGK